MIEHWVIKYCTLWSSARHITKVCDLTERTIVSATGKADGEYVEVLYSSNTPRWGWVYGGFLEILQEEFPRGVVPVLNPNPNPQSAAQYIVYLGNLQFNLCGEFCMSFIFKEQIEAVQGQPFLAKWQAKPTSFFNRVFSGGKARGTSADELKDMASVYKCETLSLSTGLYDKEAGRAVLSPGRLARWIEKGYYPIVSVHIDSQSGDLKESGVLHWVVVDAVFPDGIKHGQAVIYNPFPNQRQRVSWGELVRAMGIPYGLLVLPT